MAREYRSSLWAIELPPGWSAEEGEGCVTLSAGRGVGALQISAYRRDGEDVTDEDLNGLAGDELSGTSPRNVSCGDFSGIDVSRAGAERFWREVWLRSGPVLLYVTYNCAAEDRDVELESVNRMLSSLSGPE